jgi:peptidoglycan/LPS O-acetylase OafA/YrhL
MTPVLFLIGGAASLAYVVRRVEPTFRDLTSIGVLSGVMTLCFVMARRAAAVAAGPLASRGWVTELLRGGAPLPQAGYYGLERVPALAVWMVLCALFLYSDDEDEEPGPAVLGLIPPLLFVAMLVFGPATEHGRSTAVVVLGLIALVLTGVLVWRIVERRLRSARASRGR